MHCLSLSPTPPLLPPLAHTAWALPGRICHLSTLSYYAPVFPPWACLPLATPVPCEGRWTGELLSPLDATLSYLAPTAAAMAVGILCCVIMQHSARRCLWYYSLVNIGDIMAAACYGGHILGWLPAAVKPLRFVWCLPVVSILVCAALCLHTPHATCRAARCLLHTTALHAILPAAWRRQRELRGLYRQTAHIFIRGGCLLQYGGITYYRAAPPPPPLACLGNCSMT